MNDIVSQLVEWDKELFLFLNGKRSAFMDVFMWHVSGKWQWIPLYIFLSYLLYKVFGKSIYIPLLFIAISFSLTDQLSVRLFKDVFERLRPCHDPGIQEMVHTIQDKCGGQYGFVSNHAANTFGLATLLGLFLKSKYHLLPYLLFWALLVSYSRIYLGVHFPADIFMGGLFGISIGCFLFAIYHYFVLSRSKLLIDK